MSKLHELLAVESDLDNTYKKVIEEARNTFAKKPNLFFGSEKRLEPFQDGQPDTPVEYMELSETVPTKLSYVHEHCTRYFDAVLQKERTNQEARADIVIDGEVVAEAVPATFLLGMENKLKTIRTMYDSIPTLPSGVAWQSSVDRGEHIYQAVHPEKKYKTAKTFKHKVLYESTEHHPAQIEKWEETENVGMYVSEKWSGMITPRQKSDLIKRLDTLLRAVKRARQRANNTKVIKSNIAKTLFDYVVQDL